MTELSLLEILKYSIKSLLSSKVFILLVLELAILVIAFIFKRLMDKKVVNTTSIIASIVVLAFYISNYVDTLITFINNVSTSLMELLYFPTTLEFMIVMIISFVVMTITLLNKNSKLVIKIVNTVLPILISFLFLCIIEYINVNGIAFDEFSVFTNPILMSLYELAMGIFMSWLIGLIVYKIDCYIIASLKEKEVETKNLNYVTINLPEENIELPKLKNGVIK